MIDRYLHGTAERETIVKRDPRKDAARENQICKRIVFYRKEE
jgi:hypothetical protein